ncbi:MAG: hypothetical protein WCO94_17090 [Verrucomicrobiota bacterium]|jgi:hypothetical protein
MKPTTIDPYKMSILAFGNTRSFLLPGHRPPNRKRHTWLWRAVFFAAGIIIGWLAHGFV